MLDPLRNYLASPVFEENEEKTRLADLLKAIVLTGLAVAVIYGVFAVMINTDVIPVLVGAGLVVSLGFGVLVLMHRGHVKLGGALFSVTMWLVSTVVAFTAGGIRAPAFSSQMPVIMVAGLLLGGRTGVGFAGLGMLTGWGLLYAEAHNFLPAPSLPTTSPMIWMGQTGNFILVAAMLYLATRSINRALSQARRNEQAMARSNRELHREVTERRQAEEALRMSEERFRSIFENAVMGLYRTTPAGQIIMGNPALVKMLGFQSFKELAQRNLEESGYGPNHLRAAFKQVMEREGQVVGFESVWLKKDGSTLWVRENAKAIRDPAGHILYYEGTVEDITEHKQAEEALRESEARFRELAENIREIFWLFDWKKQRVIYASPAYETIWKRPIKDLYERYEEWGESIHPEDRAYAEESFVQITQTGGGEIREYRIIQPDGTVRWISDRGVAITDEAGQVTRIAGIADDITERKETEAAREQLVAELEAKNAELERFTYTVSHDLRSPLITIKGFLGLLQEDVAAGNTERIKGDLKHLENAADKMGLLLNDLLELSRIGRLVNVSQEIQLSELAQEAVALVSGQLAERAVQIIIKPNLPNILGDQARLVEVFQNLIENGIKFMGDQPKPQIEIGGETLEGQVICYVSDNGIGLEPGDHERVFDLFERLDQSVEGTGIGLALVKRIVELHQGRVWVESEGAGQGCTFYLSLPRAGKI